MSEDAIAEHFGLVHYVLKRYAWAWDPARKKCLRTQDYDDLFQLGCVGLLQAMRNYDRSRGLKFSTFAHRCIQWAIQRDADRCQSPIATPEWRKLSEEGIAAKRQALGCWLFSEYQDRQRHLPTSQRDPGPEDIPGRSPDPGYSAAVNDFAEYALSVVGSDLDRFVMSRFRGDEERSLAKEYGMSTRSFSRYRRQVLDAVAESAR